MKNKYLIFLILSLGIASGVLLINRFIVPIADWLGIILIILALGSLGIFIFKSVRSRKDVR